MARSKGGMTREVPEVVCIGSALWDTLGRYPGTMAAGEDRPGRIRKVLGGVALNVALALARQGARPAVLSVVGRDAEGEALCNAATARGVDMSQVLHHAELPTDAYMAIEADDGVLAAIADATSLERAGRTVLAPLEDGRLGTPDRPFAGTIVLDGNLTAALLAEIAASPLFAAADLRVAPASPGKAMRLNPFVTAGQATLYVNRNEACQLARTAAADAQAAGHALVAAGCARAIVTDGTAAAADVCAREAHSALPPVVRALRVTGAGDALLAAHLMAERQGASRADALGTATAAAARFVAEDAP